MIKSIVRSALAVAIFSSGFLSGGSIAYAQGDAVKGEKVFKRCRACHQIGPGAKNSVGPNLTGVVGRAMGSLEGFAYGSGLMRANADGAVWDEEKIAEWLKDPKAYIQSFTGDSSAKAKMTFKVRNEEQRRNVAAYLATFATADMMKDETPDRMTHGDAPFETKMAARGSDYDTSKYVRVRQELVMPPNAPKHEQVASGPPKIVEVAFEVEEKKMVIDGDGTEIIALTFNGSVPGPMIVVHEGDYVDLTLTNPASNVMEHNIDLHAATGALGGAGLTTVLPGEQAQLRFKATKPGVFIYHCAPEGTMTPYHVTHGMNGVIMVLPRDGLKDEKGEPISYDKLFYVVEQDFYVPKNDDGTFKSYETAGEDFGDWVEQMHTLTPSHVVFNGRVGSMTGPDALKADVGETVLFVHSQANRDTRPHLIGGHGDYVWEEGAFGNAPMRDLETWFVRGGSAGAALYTFRQPGVYVYLNHNLIEAVEFGAAAHVVVDGEWDKKLMEQVYHGPIR